MMKRRESSRRARASHAKRIPNFDSGVIPEPLISFGGQHAHVDPKTGLGLYGPYSPAGQKEPVLTSIVVGIVGPPAMVADAEQWLKACQGVLTNDGSEPFLHPHFPGFNRDSPFKCNLVVGDTWRETIKTNEIAAAVGEVTPSLRIKRVISLYLRAIETLSQREPKAAVILCCIPQEVIDYCTERVTRGGEVKRPKVSEVERKALQHAQSGQLFLFPELDPTLGTEDEEPGHQNLRRGLKAEAMQFGIPTQIVWPKTLRLSGATSGRGEGNVQDIATRAWNFTTALYHKAGGSPWRLAEIEPDTCFIGVSFYKELLGQNLRLRTSMAQAFTSSGDGYVLRGNSFEWDESRQGRSPHLDEKSAAALMRDVLDLYRRQNQDSLPNRIVVHKTSKYWDEELAGFEQACELVPRKDFIAFGSKGIQFYRPGIFPPIRGSWAKFSDTEFLLYTVGYTPYLRTYPGPRVPWPLAIMEHHGDSPWDIVLREILSLTKLNWNTADFACSMPITIAFSRRVGQILAEISGNLPWRQEYRFYM